MKIEKTNKSLNNSGNYTLIIVYLQGYDWKLITVQVRGNIPVELGVGDCSGYVCRLWCMLANGGPGGFHCKTIVLLFSCD